MKSLRSKLIAVTLGLALMITIAMSVVSGLTYVSSTENVLENTMIPIASRTAENISMRVENKIKHIAAAVKASSFTDAELTDELRLEYLESVANSEYFLDAALYDKEGALISSIGNLPKQSGGEQLAKEALEMEEGTSSQIMVIDNVSLYTICVPVSAVEGIGAVCVTYDAKEISRYLNSTSFSKDGCALVVDNSGDVVLKCDNGVTTDLYSQENTSMRDFFVSAAGRSSGYGEYKFEGDDFVASYATIMETGGSVIVVSPRGSLISAVDSGFINFAICALILLTVTVIVIVIMAKTISRPIVDTTQRLRSLSQGNLSDPVEVHYSKDELGVLSNSLEETVVSLRQYINLITVALTNISEGNLCHRVEGNFKGDFFKIKSTFNSILDSLSDTFASINLAAEQVSNGAVQVSNNAQALSQGSTQQASSIEELSATISDVSDQTTNNAASAKEAYRLVQSNADAIVACNQDMEKMLSAMNEISVSSSEISKIIKVIDEISFQTNILALNAAVEAAREGSKGFGVVADEVRRLASKSAEAARQTASLIENSVEAIARGSDIANQTADSLHRIVEDSGHIKKLVKDISDASEHQSEAIVQINTGVDQISAVVAENTKTAVGSASASEELSSQSLILKNMIARFKLSKTEKRGGRFEYEYIDEPEETENAAADGAEEVKILLDESEVSASESKFDPESLNDSDDKY